MSVASMRTSAIVSGERVSVKCVYPISEGAIGERVPGVHAEAERLPLLLMLGAMNVDPFCYDWLIEKLAVALGCLCAVSRYQQTVPTEYAAYPGAECVVPMPIDLSESCFDHAELDASSRGVAASIASIADSVFRLDEVPFCPLYGRVRRQLMIVGHSLGGLLALRASQQDMLPELVGVCTYGTLPLNVGPLRLQFSPELSTLPFVSQTSVPMAVLLGRNDGFVAQMTGDLAETTGEKNACDAALQLFMQGCPPECTVLAATIFDANAMSLVHPIDKSHLVSRTIIASDRAHGGGTAAEDEAREILCKVIVRFCEACLKRREGDIASIAAAVAHAQEGRAAPLFGNLFYPIEGCVGRLLRWAKAESQVHSPRRLPTPFHRQ